MKTKDERILEQVHEMTSQSSIEHKEEILDEMLISFLSNNYEDTSDAYFFVVQLKKLLHIAHENFFSYDNLLKIYSSVPRDSFENRLAAQVRDNLDNDPKWEMVKNMRKE